MGWDERTNVQSPLTANTRVDARQSWKRIPIPGARGNRNTWMTFRLRPDLESRAFGHLN